MKPVDDVEFTVHIPLLRHGFGSHRPLPIGTVSVVNVVGVVANEMNTHTKKIRALPKYYMKRSRPNDSFRKVWIL